jgi:hypothetical protein
MSIVDRLSLCFNYKNEVLPFSGLPLTGFAKQQYTFLFYLIHQAPIHSLFSAKPGGFLLEFFPFDFI